MEEKIKMKMNRQLEQTYVIVYIIRNSIKLKVENQLTNKNLITLLGVNINGERTVLDIVIENENDNHFWLDELEKIKNRGTVEIYYISTVENKNLERAIRISYPNTKTVTSLTSIITSIYKYVSFRGRSMFVKLMKEIFIQETLEECVYKIELLKEKYKDNMIVIKLIENNLNDIEKYYIYDSQMRELLFNHYKGTELFDKVNHITKQNGYISNTNEVWDKLYEFIDDLERNKCYTKIEWTKKINSLIKYNTSILDLIVKE